jgi:hypothetical protein
VQFSRWTQLPNLPGENSQVSPKRAQGLGVGDGFRSDFSGQPARKSAKNHDAIRNDGTADRTRV